MFFLLLIMFCQVSCTDYSSKIDELQQQIDQLQNSLNSQNTEIGNLGDKINALKAAAAAVSVEPVSGKDGAVVGHTVRFAEGGEVTVYNSPVNVTVEKDGGKWWWKADGEWLKDSDGNRYEAAGEKAPAPRFDITDGIMKVSFDKGATWQEVGEVGDRYVRQVDDNENEVVITLYSGETVTIPKQAPVLAIAAEVESAPLPAGASVTFPYKVTGFEQGMKVYAIASGQCSASVVTETEESGTVVVRATDSATDATDVILCVSDGKGRTAVASVPVVIIPRGRQMTFYAYHSMPDNGNNFNEVQFHNMAAANITTAHSYTGDKFHQACKYAEGTDLKVTKWMENYIYNYVGWTDEAYADMLATNQTLIDEVNDVKDEPHLWGYALIDEPRDSLFVKIGLLTKRLHELDPNHPCYVNLWGDQMCDANLLPYVTKANPDIISFDMYPCAYGFDPVGYWYDRLDAVHRYSEQYNIPWWGFAATCDMGTFIDGVYSYDYSNVLPTMGSIRVQFYTNLLYGADGLEVFTWEHYSGENGGVGWTTAPLMRDGTLSDAYYYVKTITKEINDRMFIFDGATITSLTHTKKSGAVSTKLTSRGDIPEIVSSYKFPTTGTFLVETVTNGDNVYFIVQNKTHRSASYVFLEFEEPVFRVGYDGSMTYIPATVETDDDAEPSQYEIPEGDNLIFKIK
ncbi:MAG: hypothetical protein HUJ91_04535 [Bacteroidales bacterium]|nr:hypothetical protein [Bacteroidales bacterium]